MNYDYVIFDFDGTIARTDPGVIRAARSTIERLGKPVPPDDTLKRFIGPPLYYSFKAYCGYDDATIEEGVRLFREAYAGGAYLDAILYPGIRTLLKALKEGGVWVAAASGKDVDLVHGLLAQFDLERYFDAVTGPAGAVKALDKKDQIPTVLPGGADLRRACMVGDRVYDIEGGRAAGVHTIAVEYGYGTAEEFDAAGPEFRAATVQELQRLLLGDSPLPRGRMITFEGSDGCGKSTQLRKLADWLTFRGYEVVLTREPGGCPIAERIREIILSLDSAGMTAACEALLYAASRIEHVHQVILPALAGGKIVLCDRFLDSSIAYQAYGRELGEDFVRQINRKAYETVVPDRTLLFELDRASAKARMAGGAPLDRMESEEEAFFSRLARGYAQLAQREPERIRRIDASGTVEEIFQQVLAAVEDGI